MKKSVLILSTTDLMVDARVARQVDALNEEWKVTCAAVGEPAGQLFEFIPFRMHRLSGWNPVRNRLIRTYERFLLLSRRYKHFYWRQRWVKEAFSKLKNRSFDAIIANDLDTLPLSLRIANGAKVVFDAHEYYPGQYGKSTWREQFISSYAENLCRVYGKQADQIITVSSGIAKIYKEQFDWSPILIENCPPFVNLLPTAHYRETGKVRLIHHGVCKKQRALKQLILMTDLLDDRFELHFMLITNREHQDYQELLQLAASRPKVFFHDPVPVAEITKTINRFDLGLFLLPPNSVNHRHALPNKFFDFLQARLGVVIGPSEEMAAIVKQDNLGLVSEDFRIESMARQLNSLTHDQIQQFKENANQVAATYSTLSTMKKFRSALSGLEFRVPDLANCSVVAP